MSETYFAGYIAHATIKKIKCNICAKFMCKDPNSEIEHENIKQLLIKTRMYENVPNGGLVTPNEEFTIVIQKILQFFEKNFDGICYRANLLESLCNSVTPTIVSFCSDENHKKLIVQSTLRVLIRAKLKIINSKAKQSKRKLKKFDIINHI